MAKASEIAEFLDDILKTSQIPDSSYNGLQVDSNSDITSIYGGVDATLEFFKKSTNPNNALFIVHHGIYWQNSDPRTISGNYEKIKFLLEHNSSLYASHLPLDVNKDLGHNASILRFLGVKDESFEPFGLYHNIQIGYCGELEEPVPIEKVSLKLSEIAGKNLFVFPFGRKKIKKIGVVSGGGAFAGFEAIQKGIDLFITGEADHALYTLSQDFKLSVIFATHYGTETFGVKNLCKLLNQKFSINFTFIDFEPIF